MISLFKIKIHFIPFEKEMESFIIQDKKLGFEIDKTENTPTISKITEGGALQKCLIDKCSNIDIGSEIIMVNGESIVGLNYEEAKRKIKSFTNRPVEIIIQSPRKSPSIRHISPEEMDKISREETQKALKNLVKSQVDMSNRKSEDDSESSDDNFSTDDIHKLQDKIDTLEEKYRALEFQKMNIEIESGEEIDSIKKVHDPLIIINDYILTANKFYDIRTEFLNTSSIQLSNKLSKVEKDFNESILLLNQGKKNINYMGCQILVETYIENLTKDFNKFKNIHKKYIAFKELIEIMQSISMIIVIVMIIYTYYNSNYNSNYVSYLS